MNLTCQIYKEGYILLIFIRQDRQDIQDLFNLFRFPFSPQRRRERNKINNLGVLCGSNERSEWAVSYCIKTEAISSRSRSKTTIFCIIPIFYNIIKNLNRTAVIEFILLILSKIETYES